MRYSFLIVLAAVLISGNRISGQTASFDPEIRTLYLNLDSVSGNRLLAKRYDVHNPVFIRLSGYRDFLRNLLVQSKSGYDQFMQRSGIWIQALEKAGIPDNNVPAAIAEIRLYRAMLASQFMEYKTSVVELIDCYKVVAKAGTGIMVSDRNKLSGILGIIFQLVPEQYDKFLRILGVRPSGLSGFIGLERYYTAALPGTVERLEGYLLMITALKEFNQDPAAAWSFIRTEGQLMLDNPLVRYQSALAALKAGDCATAGKLLDLNVSGNQPAPFSFWNYQTGRIKLYQNDPSSLVFLGKFIDNSGGDNYRHNALLMAGWYHLANHQPDMASSYFRRIRELPEPLTVYDRQALHEASGDKLTDPDLLKARLLFDGGYFVQCLETCEKLSVSGKLNAREQGELMYRMARCQQRLGKNEMAISSYLAVIERAESIKSYIVPNSALQAGNLYKNSGQTELARKYYKKCLDLNKYGYREGINRQASKALKDLEK